MILTGPAIRLAVERGDITVDPFEPLNLQPTSLDLSLGDEVAYYGGEDDGHDALAVPSYDCWRYGFANLVHDVADEPVVTRKKIPAEGIVLQPGRGYLLHTRERVATKKFAAVIDGKSSLGRLFIKVHETAGYVDPGFDGQYTLEVTSVYRVRVYAGMPIAQVRFHRVEGPPMLYAGSYVGETARGPVPSRIWKKLRRPT